MPIELVEHLFTPDDTLIETSSGKAGFTKFVDQFNDYGSRHIDITPKSRPIFFYHMFLASIAYLQKNELTQKLLTNKLYYKNDMENRVLKLAYRRDESDDGSSPDYEKVLKAATDIITDMRSIYKSLTPTLKVDKLTVQRQAGFLAGIFVLNLKARNIFQLHVAIEKDSIQLHMISDMKSSQNFDSKIPVVFDITSVADSVELLRIRNTINLLGFQAHPALETNSETSVYILTPPFDSPTAEEHAFVVKVRNKYEGVLRKIVDYYDGCSEDICLSEEELQDMTHEI
uniref:Uncharacterized protein n=1 Tax=Romanomermis culicivorax TaxID=13658 RepID=A0A915J7C5_ROMCU